MPDMNADSRMDRVENHFDDEAPVYDDVIERIIPGYARQNSVLLDTLEVPPGPARVADLGIGTGQLSDLVLQRHSEATVVGFDLSEGMLEQASANLHRFGDRVELVRADLEEIELTGGFAAVIAGLSVHHLENPAKRVLFGHVLDALEPGGMFLIRDVVLGDTDAENERLDAEWRAFIRGNGMDDEEVLAQHHAEDMPAPLSLQLDWLREAGFADVKVVWREMMFAIFGGVKPAA
jgi:tRNA (cmo5U34)-methyltransferase